MQREDTQNESKRSSIFDVAMNELVTRGTMIRLSKHEVLRLRSIQRTHSLVDFGFDCNTI
jgi:hypothetical protein